MTQHQAPEVTSELLGCPNPWCDSQMVPFVHLYPMDAAVTCSCGFMGPLRATTDEAITAWNTRATQPLSLTVDEILVVERLRGLLAKATPLPWVRAVICNIVTKEYHNGMNIQTNLSFKPADPALITEAVNALPALLDRLQSLSLPVGDEASIHAKDDNMDAARIAEREACAMVAEDHCAYVIAAAIRARS